jgi:hypothetical protein
VLCAASCSCAAAPRPLARQIKWLLYTCGFVAVYLPLYWISDLDNLLGMCGGLFVLAICYPIAIPSTILRYRWEIDVSSAALVYGANHHPGAGLFRRRGSAQITLRPSLVKESPVATVISTLGIAALFTPAAHSKRHRPALLPQKHDAENSGSLAARSARRRGNRSADRPPVSRSAGDHQPGMFHFGSRRVRNERSARPSRSLN